MSSLHIAYFIKYWEQDDFKQGCLSNTGGNSVLEVSFDGSNQTDLLERVMKFFDVPKENLELNACDCNGRIDVTRLEDAEGNNASTLQIDHWKQGKCRLYNAIYTGHLQLKTEATFITE